jgi:PAS domain S-box-containing protein
MNINNLAVSFFIAGILNIALGILVFLKGKKKLTNRIYSIFSFILAFWSFISFFIASSQDIDRAIFLIRIVFSYASFIPSTFYLFAICIGEEHFPKKELRKIFLFYILSICNVFIAFSPDFILEGHMGTKGNINTGPIIKYGKPEVSFYTINILFILSAGLYHLYKKKKEKSGITAIEIHYVFIGVLFGTIYNIFLTLFPIVFTKITLTDRLGPFASVIMSSIIIYGIAKYKIMDVVLVYQAISLYLLLSASLFIIYYLSIHIINSLASFFGFSLGNWSIILSGFLVAMLFVPLREKLGRFLKARMLKYDIEILTQKIFEILFSFSNPKEIFENLIDTLSFYLNIPKEILFLFRDKDDFPFENEDLPENVNVIFDKNSLFFDVLKKPKILIREEEKRVEMIYPEKKKIVEEFEKVGYEVAVGIEEKEEIKGVILFKQKFDKSVFSYRDQLIFVNLGYQIGIAIENIKLYHQISEVNTYIRSLLDNSPFGVISFDKNGKITIFNLQMERIFNKKEEDVLGKSFYEILPSEIIKDFKNKLYGLDKTITEKELQIKIDGKNLILYTLVVPIFENGKLLGVQVIFSDVTKVKQLEEEIKRNERLAALGVMAAGLAHEIKNPLVTIKTFADLFPEKYNDLEFRETYAKILNEEVNRINNLVEQVLLFAKPQILRIENINLIELLNSTISLLSFQFSDRPVKIIKNFPEKDVIIKGDREKLKEVFINILVNSYEALENKNDGIIDITLAENNKNVEVIITDNGCGIKKEIMDKIFDPFFTTKQKGTGLGLSIVLRIIEEHKGKIRIESDFNLGTKVFIEIPKIEGKNEIFDDNQ